MGPGSAPEGPAPRPALLVTGGRGKVGRAVAEAAARGGWIVDAPGRDGLDVTRREDVRRRLESLRPAWIVHAAARTDVDGCERDPGETFRVNVEGARIVALAARDAGTSLVHLSSDFVFPGTLDRPLREDDPTGARGVYARSKEEAEATVREAFPGCTVLRTSWVHGGTGQDFPRKLLPRLLRGEPLRVVEDQVGSPTYAPDLAGAIVFLLGLPEDRRPRILHFANAGSVSRLDWARAIAAALGSGSEIVPARSGEFPGPPRPRFSALDVSLYSALRGEAPRPWSSTLAETLADAARAQ